MPEVTRSPGIAVPTAGIIVGGGRTGATPALDDMVQRAAEALRDAYGQDVTIRFNSDRLSGGAWLVTDPMDRIGANAQIGIAVSQLSVSRLTELLSGIGEDVQVALAEYGADPNGPDAFLAIYAHIGNAALADKSMATDRQDDPEHCYAYVRVPDLDEALCFLQQYARLDDTPAPAP